MQRNYFGYVLAHCIYHGGYYPVLLVLLMVLKWPYAPCTMSSSMDAHTMCLRSSGPQHVLCLLSM